MDSSAYAAHSSGGGIAGLFVLLIELAFAAAIIAGWWKMFEKAGEPGWAAIIPIYNTIIFIRLAGKPIWWVILCLIPCVNIVVFILLSIEVAKAFGKDTGFGVGLGLLPFIFAPLLGFSDATYNGTKTPM